MSNKKLLILYLFSKVHTGEKPFQCSQCEYTCRFRTMLVIHERKHTGEKPFECSVCKMRFKQSGTLRDHMMTHTGEKRYACPVCDYKCIQCTDMTKHLKKHGNVPPIDLKSCLIPGMLTNLDLTHMPYFFVSNKSKSLILFRSLLLISKSCYCEHTCFY